MREIGIGISVVISTMLLTTQLNGQLFEILEYQQAKDELALSADQIEKTALLVLELRGKRSYLIQKISGGVGFRQMSSIEQADFNRKFAEIEDQLIAEERKKIASTLTKEQLNRLDQLYVQAFGVTALFGGPVCKKLEISEEQKEQLRVAAKNFETAFAEEQQELARQRKLAQENDPDGKHQAAPDRATLIAEFERRILEELVKNLTEDQQSKYAKLKGKDSKMPVIPNLK